MKPAAITVVTGLVPVLAAALLLSCSIDALPAAYQCIKDADCTRGQVCQAGACIDAVSDCNDDDQCS